MGDTRFDNDKYLEEELLDMLKNAEADVENGRLAPFQETVEGVRETLNKKKD